MAIRTNTNKVKRILETTRGKTYTVALVTIVTVVLMFAVAIVPAYISVTNQLVENEEKREYIAELQTKEDNLRALTNQEEQYRDQIDLLNTYYPDKEGDEFIMSNVAAIAEKYNAQFVSGNFNRNRRLQDLDTELQNYASLRLVPFTATFNGSLSDLQLVIAHLESFPSLIKLESITYGTLEEEGGDEDEEVVDFENTMSVEAIYYHWDYET